MIDVLFRKWCSRTGYLSAGQGIKVSDKVAETFQKSIKESAQDAAINTLNTILDIDTVIGFVDTIGITIEVDTRLTDNESKRQFKCDLKAIIVGIKSYRINKNKDIKDINIELGVKQVNRSQRIRHRQSISVLSRYLDRGQIIEIEKMSIYYLKTLNYK